jgi:hypothetical protein
MNCATVLVEVGLVENAIADRVCSGRSLAGGEGAVTSGRNSVDKQLPLDQARKFGVFEREKPLIPGSNG